MRADLHTHLLLEVYGEDLSGFCLMDQPDAPNNTLLA